MATRHDPQMSMIRIQMAKRNSARHTIAPKASSQRPKPSEREMWRTLPAVNSPTEEYALVLHKHGNLPLTSAEHLSNGPRSTSAPRQPRMLRSTATDGSSAHFASIPPTRSRPSFRDGVSRSFRDWAGKAAACRGKITLWSWPAFRRPGWA